MGTASSASKTANEPTERDAPSARPMVAASMFRVHAIVTAKRPKMYASPRAVSVFPTPSGPTNPPTNRSFAACARQSMQRSVLALPAIGCERPRISKPYCAVTSAT